MVKLIPPRTGLLSVTLFYHQLCGSTSHVSAKERRRLQKLEDSRKLRDKHKLSAPPTTPLDLRQLQKIHQSSAVTLMNQTSPFVQDPQIAASDECSMRRSGRQLATEHHSPVDLQHSVHSPDSDASSSSAHSHYSSPYHPSSSSSFSSYSSHCPSASFKARKPVLPFQLCYV